MGEVQLRGFVKLVGNLTLDDLANIEAQFGMSSAIDMSKWCLAIALISAYSEGLL